MSKRSMRVGRIMKSVLSLLNGKGQEYARIKLPLENLRKDESYQRETSVAWVNALAENWNDALCEDIWVVKRNQTFYVIDGWHRVEAMKLVGKKSCWARLYSEIEKKLEPLLFYSRNGFISRPNSFNMFKARKSGGEPEAKKIAGILSEFGLEVPIFGSNATNTVCCVHSLEKIITREDGESRLRSICQIITTAWDETKERRTNKLFFEGLDYLLSTKKLTGKIDMHRLIETLSLRDPISYIASVNSLRANTSLKVSVACAYVIARQYNRKLAASKRLLVEE